MAIGLLGKVFIESKLSDSTELANNYLLIALLTTTASKRVKIDVIKI
jgi:hypothetical protein